MRHVGASKRAFRARFPQIFTLRSFKIDIFNEFSHEPQNLLPKNWWFVRGFYHFSAHVTKCQACQDGICTLSPLEAALTKRFAKNTQHDSSKVLRLPRKMDTSKVLRLPQKTGTHLLKTSQKYCACHTNDDTLRNTSECHEVPHLPRETKLRDLWNPKSDHCCRTRYIYRPRANGCGLLRTVANGCGRLRTVPNGCATSSEHTLNPQTPRMTREPLLRIRE